MFIELQALFDSGITAMARMQCGSMELVCVTSEARQSWVRL
jgi:hypothetical protein